VQFVCYCSAMTKREGWVYARSLWRS
jgi:hypothetical protein